MSSAFSYLTALCPNTSYWVTGSCVRSVVLQCCSHTNKAVYLLHLDLEVMPSYLFRATHVLLLQTVLADVVLVVISVLKAILFIT